jgi:hypothetical protein
VDAALGRLLARAGAEASYALASHGMGPHYDATFLLGRILRRLEAAEGPRPGWTARLRARLGLGTPTRRSERRYFPASNNTACGAIRINLAGREPAGLVPPAALAEVCAGLERDLLALVNVETDQPVVRRVLRSAEQHPGPLADRFPDLLVEWNREAPIRAVTSPKTGTIRGEYQGVRTGDHKTEGLLVAWHAGARPGPLPGSVDVTCLAPTVAARLGVTLPDVDGTVVRELAGP